jgi:3-oxoadipate enol-lactonase
MKGGRRIDGPVDADVLVLSNPIGTRLEVCEPALPWLADRYRVVRYDHPDDADTVEALAGGLLNVLDELDLASASICGLSIGGAVAMSIGANTPERVDRLVLACTSARFGPPEGWLERAALVREQGTAAVAEAALGRWFTDGFTETQSYREMLLATPRETYARACEALAHWDFHDHLSEISRPTLVIAAAEDPSTPPEHGALLAERIRGARLVILDRAAHFAHVERPEAFAEAVLEHLAQEVTV